MAVFTYLDASGSGRDPSIKAISVGGFVWFESGWATLEQEWPVMLAEFGITEFHMNHFAQNVGEFAGWKGDEPKRTAFITRLTGLINRCTMQPIGATLPLSVYRLFNRHYCIQEAIGGPYTMAALAAMAAAFNWKQRSGILDPMLFFLERGDNDQSELRRFFERRIRWVDDAELPVEPAIVPKRMKLPDGTVKYVYPFQAADFMAYEQTKAITDLIVKRKTQLRQSIRQVITPLEETEHGRTYWVAMERGPMLSFVKNFRIPKRFNHFIGGMSDRSTRFVDPLFFLNEKALVGYVSRRGYLPDD